MFECGEECDTCRGTGECFDPELGLHTCPRTFIRRAERVFCIVAGIVVGTMLIAWLAGCAAPPGRCSGSVPSKVLMGCRLTADERLEHQRRREAHERYRVQRRLRRIERALDR